MLWWSMSNLERDVLICYDALHFDVSQKPVNAHSKKIAVTTVNLIHVKIIHYTLGGWKLYARRLHPLSTPSGWGLWGMTATELQTCLPVNQPEDKDFLISPSPLWLSADLKLLEAFVHIHNIFKAQLLELESRTGLQTETAAILAIIS